MTALPPIRVAEPADAAALAALARRTFSDTFGHLYAPEDLAAFLAHHTEEAWRAELADPRFTVFVAEHGGEPVAYAKLRPPKLPFEPRGASTELGQFYLLSDWQGTGLAQALMAHVIDAARASGAHDLYLSVFVDNHRARRFYERFGFERIGAYTFMVGNHADEDHVMRLKL